MMEVTYREESENMMFEGEEVLQWTMTIPDFSGNKIGTKRLKRYYQKVEQLWRERWRTTFFWEACLSFLEQQEKKRIFTPWKGTLQIDCISLLEATGEPYLSISSTVEELRGKKQGKLCVYSDLWDVSQGSPLSPGKKAEQWVGKKKEIKMKILQQAEKKEDFFFHTAYLEEIPQYFSMKNVYFTQEGACFYFPQASIAQAMEGVPVFFLPFRKGLS